MPKDSPFTERLAEALKAEFNFLSGSDESWEKAAEGIAQKMGVTEFVRDENPNIPCYWLKEPPS